MPCLEVVVTGVVVQAKTGDFQLIIYL